MSLGLRRAAMAIALLASGGAPPFAQEGTAPEPLNPLRGLAKDKLSGFRDRPLFSPTRAEPRAQDVPAPTPPPAPPAPLADPPPALRLVGIVSGVRNLAMVRPADGRKTIVLTTGDKVGAWTVTVSSDAVRLQADTRDVTITLFSHDRALPNPGATGDGSVPPPVKGADAFPPTGDPPPP